MVLPPSKKFFAKRRRVNWPVDVPHNPPQPPSEADHSMLAVLEAVAAIPRGVPLGEVLRVAVELLRERIGLERAAIMLCDWDAGRMRGTWGTNAEGHTAEEREISFPIGEGERVAFDEAREGRRRWFVLENFPNVAPRPEQVDVVRVSWVARTPLLGVKRPLGMMLNDAALSGGPVDGTRQAAAAVFCSHLSLLLGDSPLDELRLGAASKKGGGTAARALEVLRTEPSLDGEALAKRVGVSTAHLLRLIREQTGDTFVNHRNRLRLEAFMRKLRNQPEQLTRAALDAGFGSYAQFFRVFVAQYGCTPKEFFAQHAPDDPDS